MLTGNVHAILDRRYTFGGTPFGNPARGWRSRIVIIYVNVNKRKSGTADDGATQMQRGEGYVCRLAPSLKVDLRPIGGVSRSGRLMRRPTALKHNCSRPKGLVMSLGLAKASNAKHIREVLENSNRYSTPCFSTLLYPTKIICGLVKKHTKVYVDHFGWSDFYPCEVCGARAVDIHHIHPRGMGGSKTKDKIENLMALCRSCHIEYGDKKQFIDFLKQKHNGTLRSLEK